MEEFKRLNPFILEELENLDFKKILTNEQMDDRYKTFAGDALNIHIVKSADEIENPKTTFPAEYMHQLFDDEETIVGYMDPEIDIYFSPASMHCYIKIEFEDKKDEAVDLKKPFNELWESGFTEDPEEFKKLLEKDKTFKPHGAMFHEFETDEKLFQAYYVDDPTEPEFLEFNKRAQVLLLFWIETGSFIDDEDPDWKIITLFEKNKKTGEYYLCGYITYYLFYKSSDKYRCRISQQLILPNYQRKGLGVKLLESVYDKYLADVNCYEFTVEAPNSQFTLLRDFVDLKRIVDLNDNYIPFLKPSLKESITAPADFHKASNSLTNEHLTEICTKLKIRKNQVLRVFEIAMMCSIKFKVDENITSFYAKWMKKRIERLEKDSIITKIRNKHIEVDGEILEAPIEEFQKTLNSAMLKLEDIYEWVVKEEYKPVVDKIKRHFNATA